MSEDKKFALGVALSLLLFVAGMCVIALTIRDVGFASCESRSVRSVGK